MQIQVVGHHGGADDANRDVQHPHLTKVREYQGPPHFQEVRLSGGKNKNFDEVAHADGRDQQQNDGFDGAHPEPLQGQKQ